MRMRESGMPEELEWSKFFNPLKILKAMGLNNKTKDVSDFGCGYGTFSIPAAKLVSGKVYAIDIDPKMIAVVKDKTQNNAVNNIKTIVHDLLGKGSGLKNESVDYVLLFNVLHTQYPRKLLDEAFRILRTNGRAVIINWNRNATTPRGPPMKIRPTLEPCIKWCIKSGFESNSIKVYDFKPYHYGLVIRKHEV
ncbi:MAG: class I SAM-dependent methyltransferase [Hadesarchaea archaeon CG08_land_8_20_14_0_20_51_8]|nr:MAG: class I SAM-dependent methyltransferase [Hadesarchaea archaeon CG08_land_8_20_14_0_20_51_8]